MKTLSIPHRLVMQSFVIRAVLGLMLVFGIGASAHALADVRPTVLTLLPGFASFESVQYAADTPSDPTLPASGTAELVVTAGSIRVVASGVSFSNLIFDKGGALNGVQFTLGKPLVVGGIGGSSIELPAGVFNWTKPGELRTSGNAIVRLPFRNPDGSNIIGRIGVIKSTTDASGTALELGQIVLQLPTGSNVIRFPGVEVTAAPMVWAGRFPAGGATTWELRVPESTKVAVAVPGLPSSPDFPIRANVVGLRIDQSGRPGFDRADIAVGTPANPLRLAPLQFAGLDIVVKGGKLSMSGGVPSFEGLVFDITLPEGITNAAGNGRAVLLGVPVDLSRGLMIGVEKQLDAKIGDLTISCPSMVLDLSPLAALEFPGVPEFARRLPSWSGIWFRSGTLQIPIGPRSIGIELSNFALDMSGVTGKVKITKGLEPILLDGFKINVSTLSLELLRGQLIGCGIVGGIELSLGEGGKTVLDAKVEHSRANGIAIAISSPGEIDFGFGLKLNGIKGSYSQSDRMLLLSGTLSMASPAFSVKLTNFRIDANGVIYLPDEGLLTFPEPVVVDLGILLGEFRRIGFNCSSGGRKVDSVTFSGTARFKSPIEGLSFGSEMDLEHVTIGRGTGGRPVDIEIGGLSVAVEIPELGSVGGTLGLRDDLPGFRDMDVLFGDANFTLDPLGASMGVAFLLAPERQAWFVGGQAGFTPEIMVQLPSPSGPVPLFRIEGFLGGFGMNVDPIAEGGIGPIVKPAEQLKYSDGTVLMQAGLMLSDYVGGDKVWWADTTMTATLNPTMFDLTARMAFLDFGGVSGFPSERAWRSRDNTARAFMTLDLDESPSFMLGGDFDLNFPNKAFPLVEAGGEALMRFAGNEKFIHVGYYWAKEARYRQRPLTVRVGSALSDFAEVEGKAGVRFDFQNNEAEMKVDLDARFKLIPLEGYAAGTLRLKGIGTNDPITTGSLTVGGRVDFGVVEGEGRGSIDIECTKRYLELEGKIYGRVGLLSAELPIKQRID